jgi:hypothetical protein
MFACAVKDLMCKRLYNSLVPKLALPPINSTESIDLYSALESCGILEIRSRNRPAKLLFLKVPFNDIAYSLAGEQFIDGDGNNS